MNYFERRQRLHQQYAQYSGLVDASRLAHLHKNEHPIDSIEMMNFWNQNKILMEEYRISGIEFVNHLYVHVPFCKSICTFCNYERLRPSSKEALDQYTTDILQQIALFAPLVNHMEFSSIYFGGGTPSVLSANHLDTIMGALHENFRFYEFAGKHMEFDPAVMTAEKLAVANKYGFSNFSFGVQTLDANINERHNRGHQSRNLVHKRLQELKEAEVSTASCDLLLGLEGTEPAQMLLELEELLQAFEFHQIDVFLLTPTQSYVDQHFQGDFDRFWAHLKKFEVECLPKIPELAEKYDYTLRMGGGHAIHLKRGKGRRGNKYQRSYCPLAYKQEAPLNLLGLGPSARSVIYGTAHYQTMWNQEPQWIHQGAAIQLKAEAIYHLCIELRDSNYINPQLFQKLYNQDFQSLFPEAFAAWTQLDIWQVSGVELKSQTRLERTLTLMWLVDEERIEEEVNRHLGHSLTLNDLYRFFQPLQEGQTLPNGSILKSLSNRHMTLQYQGQLLDFRVTSGWNAQSALRFVRTQEIPASWQLDIQKDLNLLSKLSKRNHNRHPNN